MNNICICTWQQTVLRQTLNKSSSWILVNIWTVSGSSELNTLGWLMAVKPSQSLAGASKRAGRKENAELDPSGNIIHRVKQAYYYWRYTKLELADSTIISPRHWHRLTLSLSISPSLPSTASFSCSARATRRHSSHAHAADGGCFCPWWCRDASDMAELHRRQSAYTSVQVGAKDLTLMRNVFGSKGISIDLILTRSLAGNHVALLTCRTKMFQDFFLSFLNFFLCLIIFCLLLRHFNPSCLNGIFITQFMFDFWNV